MAVRVNPRVVYTLLSAIIIIFGTLLAIQYTKGNFRVTDKGVLPESGILAANSFPPGAEVYVDDRLVTASDDTLYLEPGQYQVKILKEGYLPWQKTLTVEKELVTQTNAQLFPQVPGLTPLTFTGVSTILPSPDGQKLVYYTASASASTKNGLYLFELTNNLLSLQRSSKQISDNPETLNMGAANFIWSPDSSQLMLLAQKSEYLLDPNKLQNLTSLSDISLQRKNILSQWEEEMYIRERQFLAEFPDEIIAIATQSATNAYLSPDKKRLLYTATASATLPDQLVPTVPAASTQPQERTIQPGGLYVYDREEDRNFRVGTMELGAPDLAKSLLATDLHQQQPQTLVASPSVFRRLQASESAQTAHQFHAYHTPLLAHTLQWFPDSKHLLYTRENEIHIMEYDGTNDTVVYSGPFASDFVYPWPDGSKLLILASFSPTTPPNLYAVELKR